MPSELRGDAPAPTGGGAMHEAPWTCALPIAPTASEQDTRAWLAARVVEPIELAGLVTYGSPRLYGRVDGERLWLGVFRPGRSRVRQGFFHGELLRSDEGWELAGRMRSSLNDRVQGGLLVVLAATATIATGAGALDVGPGLLIAAVVTALAAGLEIAGRRGRARDAATLRTLLGDAG